MMIKLLLSSIILFSNRNPASTQQKNYREIYIFVADPSNASFIAQKSIFAEDAAGLKERDLRVHEVTDAKTNAALFQKYKVSAQGFTLILVGKDGGEKLRSVKPVSLQKLFGTIDAMPMRRQEMQNKP